MAKTKISEYSATANNNTDINSINLAEGMAPSLVNNAIRQLMAQLKDFQVGTAGDSVTVGGNLSVTGTSTLTGAITATGGVSGAITSSSATITGGTITGITDLAVADGGTGASTAANARTNLSAAASGANSDITSITGLTTALTVLQGGTGVTTSTGTGNNVLSTSPTLVTPALGTPSALVGTNITGTASGLTAGNVTTNANLTGAVTSVGNATSLGSFTSAQLLGALTDETGTGSAVFATSPTLVTPALGTPSALVGTNITGTAAGLTAGNVTTNANLTGAVTSVGNATSLGSFSSANLLAALTDETGTGSLVFATSPTLVTPILGTPTSATLTNATGLPISTGVSGLGTGVATALAVNVGSAGAPLVNGGVLGTPSSGTATNLTGLPLSTGVTGQLPVANGGTGTATPSIVAGTNVTVTGTWPNQTIAASGGGGGVSYTAIKTANYTAANNDGVQTNTTAGAFTVTLPATPSNGNQVIVVDSFNTWGTNNLTIGRNGSTIEGVAQDLVCDITGVSVQCVYNGTTWDIFAQVGGAGGNASQWTTSGSQVYFTGSIGVGTSAINSWYSDNKAIDMPAGSVFSYLTTNQYIGQNTFVNASGNQVAKNTGLASIYVQSAGLHQFASAPSVSANSTQTFTTLLDFGKGKTLALESATSVSGTGISFPSTQSASTDANTLDDYEEGTWTPSISLNTGTATTYGTQAGTYTKTGRMVVCLGVINPSNGTLGSAGGYIRMTGLPFTVGTRSGAGSGGNISNLNNGVSTTFAYSTTVDATFESGSSLNADYVFVVTYFV